MDGESGGRGGEREDREKIGERGRGGKSPITKSLLTTFLHTAVGVSRVIQCSKAKSELVGVGTFKRHKLLHWQLKQNSTKRRII